MNSSSIEWRIQVVLLRRRLEAISCLDLVFNVTVTPSVQTRNCIFTYLFTLILFSLYTNNLEMEEKKRKRKKKFFFCNFILKLI